MTKKPVILITNDDGINAPGLDALVRACARAGETWVAAPEREMSACSRAISLRTPLRLRRAGERRFAVDGTPTDCVYLAMTHILPRKPDLVLSGINTGPNMGDDVYYSGTVAAAMEGALFGVRAMAVSLDGYREYEFEAPARFAVKLALLMAERGWDAETVLNVNLPPRLSPGEILWRTTFPGIRDYGRGVVERVDPRGRPYFWIGGDALGMKSMPGSDLDALKEGVVSVCPLKPRFDHEATDKLLRELDFKPMREE